MTRSSTIYILWDEQNAICGGSKSECIAVARKEGLLIPAEHGEYKLILRAAIISYPAAEAFRIFDATEVERAKEAA